MDKIYNNGKHMLTLLNTFIVGDMKQTQMTILQVRKTYKKLESYIQNATKTVGGKLLPTRSIRRGLMAIFYGLFIRSFINKHESSTDYICYLLKIKCSKFF